MGKRINEIILHGGEKQAIARPSPWAHQFMQLGKKKPEKKIQGFNGIPNCINWWAHGEDRAIAWKWVSYTVWI